MLTNTNTFFLDIKFCTILEVIDKLPLWVRHLRRVKSSKMNIDEVIYLKLHKLKNSFRH